MPTFLFDKIIFGPVKSRRLGLSLGINLLPTEYKFCSFDCIYCECGYTFKEKYTRHPFHSRTEVREKLEKTLLNMKSKGGLPDHITFAGNGEPTLHPEFGGIIDDTTELRNAIAPQAKIAVLTNATVAHKTKVKEALLKVDQNILKLDSAVEETFKKINRPQKGFTLEKLTEILLAYNGHLTVQTMFLKGIHQNEYIDNTTEAEISAWLDLLKKIKPRNVMIYTVDRDTPSPNLQKTDENRMNDIARQVRKIGLDVQVSV